MKFVWEPKDIVCGRIVCKGTHQFSERKNPVERGFKPDGWTAKWTFKIGWLAGGNAQVEPDYTNHETIEATRCDYCLISMSDGRIGNPKTKQEMADWLNSEEMIPMSYEWLVPTMEFLREVGERGNGW